MLYSVMDSEHGIGSGKQSRPEAESMANSASDDFFRVDPIKSPDSNRNDHIVSPKPKGRAKKHVRDEINDVANEALSRLEEFYRSSSSTSQVSDVTHESFIPNLSPTQSPPIQVMERPGDYDPNRIPSSIFSKPSTPGEWSLTSNDSLFSIQIGHSLSRDLVPAAVVESYNSEEYSIPEVSFKSNLRISDDEQFTSTEQKDSDELRRFGKTASGTKEEKQNPENLHTKKTRVLEKPVGDSPYRSINVLNEPSVKGFKNENSKFHPIENGANNHPFAFLKKKKASRSLCLCSNCSWMFCYCTLPRCSCKLKNCCCKRPSCSCKWLSCSSCSCKWICRPSCCCKLPNWSGCCKWPSCGCKSCKSCSLLSCGCKSPSWPSCGCKCSSWPSCGCKFPSWPSCGCKFPSWPSCGCKFPSWPSCHYKCPTWSSCCCCKCSNWSSCCNKCHCSNCCRPSCCCTWKNTRKIFSCIPFIILTDGKESTKKQSAKWCSCSCCCSCCSSCSFSCC